jgi:membrane protein
VKAVDRVTAGLTRARERWGWLDHTVRAVAHYLDYQGNVFAGAVTYYGFLSVFPLLILAYSVLGFVTGDDPVVTREVTDALEQIFPGLVGTTDAAPINVARFQDAASTASLIGSATLIYTGLAWMGALRVSLQTVFTLPQSAQPGIVPGILWDLVYLVVLGATLVVSVSLSAAVTSVTDRVLDAAGLDTLPGYAFMLRLLGIGLGICVSTVLFFAMYRLLPRPELPNRALLEGALLAAVAFEVLKLVATTLISFSLRSPTAAVAGTFVVLLIWINYFSRLIFFGGSWAATTRVATRVLPDLREQATD